MYAVSEGAIKERFPHRWSSCGASRLESIPFYHAYPGSRCLAIGTLSCNFRCKYCSNAFVAKEDPAIQQELLYNLSPRELVNMAKKLNCSSIVFNVNEPTVSIPSLMDLAEEAKASGLPMGCLTNGYMTVESTELLASIFSFFNISLKGISFHFNKTYIGINFTKPVLRNIRRLARDRHVEVTTPIIEGANDGDIDTIVDFLSEVDREIPWHVFRLLPEDEMTGDKYPDIRAIDAALKSARKRLPYIYFHNFVGSEWVDTLCPACGTVVIERFSLGCGGDKLKRLNGEGKLCPTCGHGIKLLTGTIRDDFNGARQ